MQLARSRLPRIASETSRFEHKPLYLTLPQTPVAMTGRASNERLPNGAPRLTQLESTPHPRPKPACGLLCPPQPRRHRQQDPAFSARRHPNSYHCLSSSLLERISRLQHPASWRQLWSAAEICGAHPIHQIVQAPAATRWFFLAYMLSYERCAVVQSAGSERSRYSRLPVANCLSLFQCSKAA